MDTMTENDYLIAWGLYAFAAVGCLLVWMRLTRWMWRWLREPLRVLMAVLLFSPTIIDPVKAKVAPSIAITALDQETESLLLLINLQQNDDLSVAQFGECGQRQLRQIGKRSGADLCNDFQPF